MKTQRCDECVNLDLENDYEGRCLKDHKLRFYQPKGPLDFNYGYKRKCEDFKQESAPRDAGFVTTR